MAIGPLIKKTFGWSSFHIFSPKLSLELFSQDNQLGILHTIYCNVNPSKIISFPNFSLKFSLLQMKVYKSIINSPLRQSKMDLVCLGSLWSFACSMGRCTWGIIFLVCCICGILNLFLFGYCWSDLVVGSCSLMPKVTSSGGLGSFVLWVVSCCYCFIGLMQFSYCLLGFLYIQVGSWDFAAMSSLWCLLDCSNGLIFRSS